MKSSPLRAAEAIRETALHPCPGPGAASVQGGGVIEYLEICRFRQVAGPIHIPIRPITLVVGPTASGKSCFRDALWFIDTVLHGSNAKLLDCATRWSHSGDGSSPLRVEVGLGPTNLTLADGCIKAFQDRLPERLMFHEDDLNPLWLESGIRPRLALTVEANGNGLSLLAIAANGQMLVQVERDHPAGFGLLKVNPNAFGSALWQFALQDCDLSAESEDEFTCRVVWRHEPLALEIPHRSDNGDFDQALADLANYLVAVVTQRLGPTSLVNSAFGVPSSAVHSIMATASAEPAKGDEQHSPLGWQLDARECSTSHADLTRTPTGGAHPLDFSTAVSRLALSWLETEAQHRAEDRLRSLGVALPPARVDTKPHRDPFHATPLGEQESWTRGRDPNARLAEPLHAFVSRLFSHLLRDSIRIEHSLLEHTQPELGNARSSQRGEQDQELHDVPTTVLGRVQTSFIDRFGATIDPQALGDGVCDMLPVLVALHAGSCYLEHPTRELDAEKQQALAELILERVRISPVTIFLMSADMRLIKHLLAALLRSPGDLSSSPGLYSDQIAVTTFVKRRDGTASAFSTTFNERTDFLSEKTRELLSMLE